MFPAALSVAGHRSKRSSPSRRARPSTERTAITRTRAASLPLYALVAVFAAVASSGASAVARPYRQLSSARATALAAGNIHACALTSAGAVKCWGDNEEGQLGDGTTAERHRPVAVIGFGGTLK